MAELLDLQNVGPEETIVDPMMVQQIISWKKGHANSGGPFTFLNEDGDTILQFVEGDGLYAAPDDGTAGVVMRVLVDEYHGFVAQIIMTDADPSGLPATWHVCDGVGGTPDLRDRFIVGAGATYAVTNSGGSATVSVSHSHTLNNHVHGMNSHQHSLGSHTHNVNNHQHGLGSHAHSLGGHAHSLSSHTHTAPAHNHLLSAASITGSTGTVNEADNSVDAPDGGSATGTNPTNHTHQAGGLDVAGSTDAASYTSTDQTAGPSTTNTGTETVSNTGNASGATDNATATTGTEQGSGNTGTASGNTEGPSNNATSSDGSSSLSILPPYYALYYVKRVA